MDIKETLGYLTGKMEEAETSRDRMSTNLDDHIEREELKMELQSKSNDERFTRIEEKLDKVVEKINYAKHLGMFLKTLGGIILLAVTIRFGDIPHLWEDFWRLK